MKKAIFGATAAAALLVVGAASAATVSESAFSKANWDAFVAGKVVVVENFEGLGAALGAVAGAEYLAPDGFDTAVGTFIREDGDDGDGLTVSESTFPNIGEGVALRSGNVYGRTDTTSVTKAGGVDSGNWFFDSNDLSQVRWDVSIGGGLFDSLIFSLMDPADQGATFTICVDDGFDCSDYELTNQSGSTKRLITIDFGMNIAAASVFFQSAPGDDGWGLDDVAVNAVPIPAAGFLLLGGLGALGFAARRKRKDT